MSNVNYFEAKTLVNFFSKGNRWGTHLKAVIVEELGGADMLWDADEARERIVELIADGGVQFEANRRDRVAKAATSIRKLYPALTPKEAKAMATILMTRADAEVNHEVMASVAMEAGLSPFILAIR